MAAGRVKAESGCSWNALPLADTLKCVSGPIAFSVNATARVLVNTSVFTLSETKRCLHIYLAGLNGSCPPHSFTSSPQSVRKGLGVLSALRLLLKMGEFARLLLMAS